MTAETVHQIKQLHDKALRLLDEIDGAPFGTVDKKLDQITETIIAAKLLTIISERRSAA